MGLFSRARRPEVRDPSAATGQVRWVGKGQPQIPAWNQANAVTKGYLASVVAYRCIAIIADTITAQSFLTGAAAPESTGGTAKTNPSSALAALLGMPTGRAAPKLSAQRLWRWTIMQRLATGRAAWEIELGDDRPVALWPLASPLLEATPSDGGIEWWSAYRYGRPDKKVNLPVDRVFHTWDSSDLSDFREPFSPLRVARYPLSVSQQVDEYNYGFLKSGGVPAALVSIPAFQEGAEGAQAFEAFKRQWDSEFTGAANQGRTYFREVEPDDQGDISSGIHVEILGARARDMQLTELHAQSLREVAMALGVPWSKLDASGRTFDNAKEEDRSFYEGTILPLATALADDVNIELAPRLGGEVGWFDFSNVRALAPTPPMAAGEAITLVEMGGATFDEIRPWYGLTGPAPEFVGEGPAPNGQPAPPPVTTGGATDATLPVERGSDPGGHRDAGEARRAREAEARRQEAARQEELRATVDQEKRRRSAWLGADALIRGQERVWERTFRRLFARQQASVVEKLKGGTWAPRFKAAGEARSWQHEERAIGDSVFNAANWRQQTEDIAHDLFEQLAAHSFARLTDKLGISFDLEAEFAIRFINARANQLAGQVTDTTYAAIQAQLSEGVAAGEGIPGLAARISQVFDDASRVRATAIARTEVVSAHNASSVTAALTLPADVVAGQQWIATRDDRTRPEHEDADGQIVAVGHAFDVGGEGLAYPGDPNGSPDLTVNCRCTVAFLTPDEFAAEADIFAGAQAQQPVPLERARALLGLVSPGEFDEVRFSRALEVAA